MTANMDKRQYFNAVLDILDTDYDVPHYMQREVAESITAFHWGVSGKHMQKHILSPEEAVAMEMANVAMEEFV